MGGKSTKQVGNNRQDTLLDKPNTIIDKSSGFHIVELHMPTVTSGSAVLVVLVIAVVIAILLYRKCQRSGGQGSRPQHGQSGRRFYEEQQAIELQQFRLRHLLAQVQHVQQVPNLPAPQFQVSTASPLPALTYASVPGQQRDTTLLQTC